MRTTPDASFFSTAQRRYNAASLAWVATPGTRNTERALVNLRDVTQYIAYRRFLLSMLEAPFHRSTPHWYELLRVIWFLDEEMERVELVNTFYQRPLYLRLASTVTTIITSPTCEARLLRKSLTSRDYWASTNLISFVFKTSTRLVSA